jgi:sulfite exporter TauE/SafE
MNENPYESPLATRNSDKRADVPAWRRISSTLLIVFAVPFLTFGVLGAIAAATVSQLPREFLLYSIPAMITGAAMLWSGLALCRI